MCHSLSLVVHKNAMMPYTCIFIVENRLLWSWRSECRLTEKWLKRMITKGEEMRIGGGGLRSRGSSSFLFSRSKEGQSGLDLQSFSTFKTKQGVDIRNDGGSRHGIPWSLVELDCNFWMPKVSRRRTVEELRLLVLFGEAVKGRGSMAEGTRLIQSSRNSHHNAQGPKTGSNSRRKFSRSEMAGSRVNRAVKMRIVKTLTFA